MPFKKTILILTLLCAVSILPPTSLSQGAREIDRLRARAFEEYRAGNFEKALPLIQELLKLDRQARFWMDYFIAADIHLRQGETDSARVLIELGAERTKALKDKLVVNRNNDIWNQLRRQLKYQREYLTIPKYKPLEEYAKIDSGATELGLKDEFGALSPFSVITSEAILLNPPVKEAEDTSEIKFNSPPALKGGYSAVRRHIEGRKLYPDSARAAKVGIGAVIVDVTVDTMGRATGTEVFLSYPEGLGFEALACSTLAAMEYRPAYGDSSRIVGKLRQAVMFKCEEILESVKAEADSSGEAVIDTIKATQEADTIGIEAEE